MARKKKGPTALRQKIQGHSTCLEPLDGVTQKRFIFPVEQESASRKTRIIYKSEALFGFRASRLDWQFIGPSEGLQVQVSDSRSRVHTVEDEKLVRCASGHRKSIRNQVPIQQLVQMRKASRPGERHEERMGGFQRRQLRNDR